MTAFLNDAARAALIVGIALLVLTAAARALLRERLARPYLEALGTWCLIALAVNLLAVAAAGGFDAGAFAPAVAVGLATALLVGSAEAAHPTTEPMAAAPRPTDQPPTRSPVSVPPGRLWSGPLDDDPPRRGDLWRR
jgi:hypothetical protein